MLGSITPLGERGRNQRWGVTVAAFVIGSTAAGAITGGALGWIGSRAAPPELLPESLRLAILGALLLAGAALDSRAAGLRLPTTRRQVNEDWLPRYRGWVYGGAFGLQLGMGVITIVSASAVYLTFGAAFLSGGAVSGAALGGVFGLMRAAPALATAGVTRPDQLLGLASRLRAWDRPALVMTRGLETALGTAALVLAVAR